MERLSQLAEIGADGERGGTTRPGLSVDEQRACELVAEWCEEEGLAVSWDAAGNLYRPPAGRAATASPRSGPAPTSTRCPAAAGSTARWACSAALEAVAALGRTTGWRRRSPSSPSATRRAGASAAGFFGSRARVRRRVTEDELERRDADGVPRPRCARRAGPGGAAGRRPAARHVRRGARRAGPAARARRRPAIAVVGCDRRDGRLHGDLPRRAGHAGTTPMAGAATPSLRRRRARDRAARRRPRRSPAPSSPSATCASPARPRTSCPAAWSWRSTPARRRTTALQALLDAVEAAVAAAAAARTGCSVDLDRQWISAAPVRMSERVRAALAGAAAAAGVAVAELHVRRRPRRRRAGRGRAWTPGCCSCAA